MEFPMIRPALYAIVAAAIALVSANTSVADTFLKVGVTAGGGYDFAARLMAPYLEKHLGGESVIVQNVQGASSLNLARQMQVSDADNEIGLILASQIVRARLNPDAVAVDFSAFQWLGSLNSVTSICLTSKESGVDTFEKLISEDIKMGATSQTGGFYQLAALVKNSFGGKYEIITGFKGLTDIEAAVQRGEIAGYCGSQLDRYIRNNQKGTYNLIGSAANEIELDEKVIPSFASFASNDETQAAIKLFSARDEIYYPFFMAPGASQEAVMRYRAAFDAVMKDPEFLKEALAVYIDMNPANGSALEAKIKAVSESDPATVSRLIELTK